MAGAGVSASPFGVCESMLTLHTAPPKSEVVTATPELAKPPITPPRV